jgi:hypothetical protein
MNSLPEAIPDPDDLLSLEVDELCKSGSNVRAKADFWRNVASTTDFFGTPNQGSDRTSVLLQGMNDAMTGLAEQSCCLGEAGAQ